MSRPLIHLAAACLIGASGLGVVLSVAAALPDPIATWVPFSRLRPLHTLLALGWVLVGLAATVRPLVGAAVGRGEAVLYAAWLGTAAAALIAGTGSGREYLSWPAPVSLLLLGALLAGAWAVLRGLPRLRHAVWDTRAMIGIGVVLLPLGLIEGHLWLLPSVSLDPGRDLAVEWHALDTMIGGWNIVLYGAAATLLPREPGRGRAALLAATLAGLLLSYGHHHYPSPQPRLLKDIAFGASLLAGVAFLDHARAGLPPTGGLVRTLLRAAAGWTLVALLGGFLMAIPPLNALVHGTWVVVAHAMGAMIGVNSMLILALGFHATKRPTTPGLLRAARVANVALALMVADLVIAGLLRGALRPGSEFAAWRSTVELALAPLLVIGPVLAVCLATLAVALVASGEPADAESRGD